MNDVTKAKRKLIDQMLKMQKEFMEREHKEGMAPADYWSGTDTDEDPVHGYKEKYDELATKVVDLAHKEKGSKR